MRHCRTRRISLICFKKDSLCIGVTIYAYNVNMVNQTLVLKDVVAFKQKLHKHCELDAQYCSNISAEPLSSTRLASHFHIVIYIAHHVCTNTSSTIQLHMMLHLHGFVVATSQAYISTHMHMIITHIHVQCHAYTGLDAVFTSEYIWNPFCIRKA